MLRGKNESKVVTIKNGRKSVWEMLGINLTLINNL